MRDVCRQEAGGRSLRSVDEESSFLAYDLMSTRKSLSAFQSSLLNPSSGYSSLRLVFPTFWRTFLPQSRNKYITWRYRTVRLSGNVRIYLLVGVASCQRRLYSLVYREILMTHFWSEIVCSETLYTFGDKSERFILEA